MKTDVTMVGSLAHAVLMLVLVLNVCITAGVRWENDVRLDENFRMLWTLEAPAVEKDAHEVVFEVQVRTLGYVGLGFSLNGELAGADMAIGWIHQGQTYFQDRHVKSDGSDLEPVVDPSQDYVLISGYENVTHTVLRFRRKLDTCDASYDVPITNDTMRVLYMYHEHEPQRGSVIAGNLPDPGAAFRGHRSLFLTQTPKVRADNDGGDVAADAADAADEDIATLELRNVDVELPMGDDTLHWCKMFKLQDIAQKSHVIKYEPVFDSAASMPYMQHIILYECQPDAAELEQMSREPGRQCNRPNGPPLSCNAIVATWARGSEGFAFPAEAGYALDTAQTRFYLMETHYNNPISDNNAVDGTAGGFDQALVGDRPQADNSGLRLYYTRRLRAHDAGVLSIGMDPNWRHIIPPFQHRVVSDGHCIEGCTRRAFPRSGILIFAVMMRTHLIGREIKLRHQRKSEEFAPVAHDRNVDPNYQEYRRLPAVVRAMPGDRLIAQCTYDSSRRDQITLGGPTTREESCIVLTYYYPRQKRLTTCHSLPSLPTVLHSLGIEELASGSNPVLIASPAELTGMTLESRLLTYDWKNQFDAFQQVTQHGSFKAICWDARNKLMPGTDSIEGHNLNITKSWTPPPGHCAADHSAASNSTSAAGPGSTSAGAGTLRTNSKHRSRTSNSAGAAGATAWNGGVADTNDVVGNDGGTGDSLNIIEGATRNKVARSSASGTMGLSGGRWSSCRTVDGMLMVLLMTTVVAVALAQPL